MLAQQSYRWYDPHHAVLLGDDSVYAEGAFYALRSHVIEGILLSGLLPRAGGPEGACPLLEYQDAWPSIVELWDCWASKLF